MQQRASLLSSITKNVTDLQQNPSTIQLLTLDMLAETSNWGDIQVVIPINLSQPAPVVWAQHNRPPKKPLPPVPVAPSNGGSQHMLPVPTRQVAPVLPTHVVPTLPVVPSRASVIADWSDALSRGAANPANVPAGMADAVSTDAHKTSDESERSAPTARRGSVATDAPSAPTARRRSVA
jgi:hypothetical protein